MKGFGMELQFLANINYLAVLVSAVAFFMLGALWFSVLFKDAWTDLAYPSGMKERSKEGIATNMVLTFLTNLIASFAMACFVAMTHSTSIQSGLVLGIIGAAFAAIAVAGVFIWENKPLKLFLIDAGYPVFGILLSALLLSLWR